MKKITKAVIAIAAAALAFTGCTKKAGTNDGPVPQITITQKTENEMLKIGIIQLAPHPALDANCKGFIDGLADAGYIAGKNIVIDYQNAQGDIPNCGQIASKFVNNKSDLIFAIATPAAQSVANKTTEIPVLVSSVTDPKDAKLVKSNELPRTNVSGTSDLTPVDEQIKLIKKIIPGAKKVGLMYCSNEPNSIFQINLAKKACEEEGLEYVEGSVSAPSEITQVTTKIASEVNVIYIPTDNMLAANMATVSMVANESMIPCFVGEEGMVENGGLLTIGINYYDLGKQTAAMAVELFNGANVAEMPIQYQKKFDLTVNEKQAEYLGIKIPSEL